MERTININTKNTYIKQNNDTAVHKDPIEKKAPSQQTQKNSLK